MKIYPEYSQSGEFEDCAKIDGNVVIFQDLFVQTNFFHHLF